jgi:hypothetical protein
VEVILHGAVRQTHRRSDLKNRQPVEIVERHGYALLMSELRQEPGEVDVGELIVRPL